MELGAARMGVAKGGKKLRLCLKEIYMEGKAKDYPGIKQLMVKDMKKKGTRPER